MERQMKEIQKLLDGINSDLEEIMKENRKLAFKGTLSQREGQLESLIKSEFAEVRGLISKIDNQIIAETVSRMVVNQIMSPLQEAIEAAMNGPEKKPAIGKIAEDMKRRVERLSDRHIRVIRCLTQAKGEWVNYDSLSEICRISQSCLRGYVSDLTRVYEIPIERSVKSGKTFVRLDPQTVKKIAFCYQALKLDAS